MGKTRTSKPTQRRASARSKRAHLLAGGQAGHRSGSHDGNRWLTPSFIVSLVKASRTRSAVARRSMPSTSTRLPSRATQPVPSAGSPSPTTVYPRTGPSSPPSSSTHRTRRSSRGSTRLSRRLMLGVKLSYFCRFVPTRSIINACSVKQRTSF